MINLQKTPIDHHAALVIHGKTDDVMKVVMKKLAYDAPVWQLKRRLQMKVVNNEIQFMGVDSNGAPYVLFKELKVTGLSAQAKSFAHPAKQPFRVAMDNTAKKNEENYFFNVELKFMAHYAEPTLNLKINLAGLIEGQQQEVCMNYDAGKTGKWDLCILHDKDRTVIDVVDFK